MKLLTSISDEETANETDHEERASENRIHSGNEVFCTFS